MLADLAEGRLREKRDQLEEALDGVVNSHQRFMLGVQLSRLSTLESQIGMLDTEVARRVSLFQVVRG